jgi:hypothetical protein
MSEQSTSRDLVEQTRVILDAADRADFDALLKFYAPDSVWELRAGGTFRGVDAIRDLWEGWPCSHQTSCTEGSRDSPRPRSVGDSVCGSFEKRMKGFEPSTFAMARRRSSQLSYIRATRPF